MDHRNGNVFCGIDIQTSGPDVGKHEIWQVALITATLDLSPKYSPAPFNVFMRPEKSNLDVEQGSISQFAFDYREACLLQGVDQFEAAEALLTWKEKVVAREEKRIIPICYDWAQKKPFLVEWLGHKTFDLIFDGEVRDPLPMLCAVNDRAYFCNEKLPYPKPWLERFVWSTMKIVNPNKYDALQDADAVIKVYKKLIADWHR